MDIEGFVFVVSFSIIVTGIICAFVFIPDYRAKKKQQKAIHTMEAPVPAPVIVKPTPIIYREVSKTINDGKLQFNLEDFNSDKYIISRYGIWCVDALTMILNDMLADMPEQTAGDYVMKPLPNDGAEISFVRYKPVDRNSDIAGSASFKINETTVVFSSLIDRTKINDKHMRCIRYMIYCLDHSNVSIGVIDGQYMRLTIILDSILISSDSLDNGRYSDGIHEDRDPKRESLNWCKLMSDYVQSENPFIKGTPYYRKVYQTESDCLKIKGEFDRLPDDDRDKLEREQWRKYAQEGELWKIKYSVNPFVKKGEQ